MEVKDRQGTSVQEIGKVNILHFGVPPTASSGDVTIGAATLTVKSKIPYEELIEAIEWCINAIVDDRTFISAPLKAIISDISILKFYTNLDTDDIAKDYFSLSDFYEWYDIIKSFNVMSSVLPLIDAEQIEFFRTTMEQTLTSIVAYNNSAAGIVDKLSSQNAKTNADMQTVLSQLSDDEQLSQVRKLMEVFGQDPLPLNTKE